MASSPAEEPGVLSIEAPADLPENADIIFSPSFLRRTSSSSHSTVSPSFLARKWASLRSGAKGVWAEKPDILLVDGAPDTIKALLHPAPGEAPEGEHRHNSALEDGDLDNVPPLERQQPVLSHQSNIQRSKTAIVESSKSEDLLQTGKLPSLSSWASDAANGDKRQYAAMYAAITEKVMRRPCRVA